MAQHYIENLFKRIYRVSMPIFWRDVRINKHLQGLQASLFKFFNKSLQKIESNPIIHLLLQYRIIKLLNNFVRVSWLNNFLFDLIIKLQHSCYTIAIYQAEILQFLGRIQKKKSNQTDKSCLSMSMYWWVLIFVEGLSK